MKLSLGISGRCGSAAKRSPHRPGISRAPGLRARSDVVFILSQTGRSVMTRSRIAVALGAVALTAFVGSVCADIRLNIPEDITPPAYTSPDGLSGFQPGVIQDGEWAAIPFYRPPECVPLDFNLLDWYDGSLNALDCPLLVEGFIVWPDPETNNFPRSSELRGLGAVPIWF